MTKDAIKELSKHLLHLADEESETLLILLDDFSLRVIVKDVVNGVITATRVETEETLWVPIERLCVVVRMSEAGLERIKEMHAEEIHEGLQRALAQAGLETVSQVGDGGFLVRSMAPDDPRRRPN